MRKSVAGLALGALICAVPHIGYSVITSSAETVTKTSYTAFARRPAHPENYRFEAPAPVEVVLAHAKLQRWAAVAQAPLALPISFGRPVAPEDEASPPPPRWHHKRKVHHAHFHHAVAPSPDDITELEPSDLGGATPQGDDDSAQ